MPLVSTIVIFLNAEKFLKEAIESVFAQTYTNWELLLVDDGSTDASTNFARECAEQHSENVHYLEHPRHQNRGMSAARNLGISTAKGEYIAFLDSDDIWMPRKLEQQLAILASQSETGMIYGASQYWYSWTGSPHDSKRDYVPELGIAPNTLVRPPTLLTLALQSKAPTASVSNILLRRELLERVGGFEESFTGMYEDQAFLAKVYLNTSVFVANQCWDRYRQHPDSCVSVVTNAGQKYAAGLFYLNWLEQYLSAAGVRDGELWNGLRTKRRHYRYPKLSPYLERVQYRMEQVKRIAQLNVRRTLE